MPPVTDSSRPNLPIVATNVGEYRENINPKEDKDKDGVEEVEAPKVVDTTPAALVEA